MKKYTPFTRSTVRQLRDDLNGALANIAKTFGVEFDLGSATFQSNQVRFRLEVNSISADGTAYDQEVEDFKRYAPSIGLQPTDLGKIFPHGRKMMKIVGFKASSRAYPITVEDQNGKRFKMDTRTVKALLGSPSGEPSFPAFAFKEASRLPEEIIADLRHVESELSPENLTCDGELPKSRVNQKLRELTAKRRALVKELGREPTDEELYPNRLYGRKAQ
jgi:hypothetical protein